MNPGAETNPPSPRDLSARSSESRFGWWLSAILGVAAAGYLAVAAEDPIFQRAEDYFAEAAREMSFFSQHITPILYGKPFFDKPIWTYWGIQASFALFGPTHFAARVPSILAALVTIALTAYGTARIGNRRAGLMAAAVLATSYMFFYYAALAMSDLWLTLFCAAAAAFFFAGSETPERRLRDWSVAAAFCGWAMLTKGPVGVVLPVAALGLYLAIRRELGQIRLRYLAAGLLVFAAVAAPWYALLWERQGVAALRAFFFVENVQRFMGEAYVQGKRPIAYIPISFLVDFLPWTIFLPAALTQSVRTWRRDWNARASRGELFLWCYIATVVGFFWLARTQMDYYVLPAMPACAVLTGIYLDRAAREDTRFLRVTNWIAAAAWCAAGLALLGVALAAKGAWRGWPQRPVPAGLAAFWPLAIWMIAGGAAAAILTKRRNYAALLGLTLAGFSGGAALAVHEAIPFYLKSYPLPTLANEAQHGDVAAALSIDLEHWRGELSFEDRRVLELTATPEEFASFVGTPGPHVAILTDRWRATLPANLRAPGEVIYTMPILRQGITLKDLLDPKMVAQTTDGIAVIYFAGAASADSAPPGRLPPNEFPPPAHSN